MYNFQHVYKLFKQDNSTNRVVAYELNVKNIQKFIYQDNEKRQLTH